MECYIHPAVNYLRVNQLLEAQRAFLLEFAKTRSRAHQVHPGVDIFRTGKRLSTAVDIPGMDTGAIVSYDT